MGNTRRLNQSPLLRMNIESQASSATYPQWKLAQSGWQMVAKAFALVITKHIEMTGSCRD